MPRRRPPRVLDAASAVLLAAVVGLWVRSQWAADELQHTGAGTQWIVGTSRDTLYVIRAAGQVNNPRDLGWAYWQDANPRYDEARWAWYWSVATTEASALGLTYLSGPPPGSFYTPDTPNLRFRAALVPLWFLVVLAVIPLAWAALVRRRRRPPPGHCRSCGYDLTANASGRCPECGTACASSSTTTATAEANA
jgi:hypothetical protein